MKAPGMGEQNSALASGRPTEICSNFILSLTPSKNLYKPDGFI